MVSVVGGLTDFLPSGSSVVLILIGYIRLTPLGTGLVYYITESPLVMQAARPPPPDRTYTIDETLRVGGFRLESSIAAILPLPNAGSIFDHCDFNLVCGCRCQPPSTEVARIHRASAWYRIIFPGEL